jgi:hypothetical protein
VIELRSKLERCLRPTAGDIQPDELGSVTALRRRLGAIGAIRNRRRARASTFPRRALLASLC